MVKPESSFNKTKTYRIINLPSDFHERGQRINEWYDKGWELVSMTYRMDFRSKACEYQEYFKRKK